MMTRMSRTPARFRPVRSLIFARRTFIAGYTIKGTDQESVEAEAEFEGPHEGTIKVQPLCKDTVEIRYEVET